MKNIIWIICFLVFLIRYIYCKEGLLSKFHQTGYKLKDDRIQLMSYNKNNCNFFEIKAFKYNRTTTAHNITFNLKVDAKDHLEVIVQANKFLSNEYRHFPVRFQANVKEAIDSNAMGFGSARNCGNLTTSYWFKDVTYYVCNFVIDETHFPPLIPDGKYRADLTVTYLNTELALAYLYAEVYTPVRYSKKKKLN